MFSPETPYPLPSRSLARACGARLIYYVVWNMRFAHVPHHIVNCLRGEAAREAKMRGRKLQESDTLLLRDIQNDQELHSKHSRKRSTGVSEKRAISAIERAIFPAALMMEAS